MGSIFDVDEMMDATVSVNQNPSTSTWRQGKKGFAVAFACRLLSKGGLTQEDHRRSRCQLHWTLLSFFHPIGTEAVAVQRFKRSTVRN